MAPPPWIFIHGTNIVDRGLKVLFFGVFKLFFGAYQLFFGLFSVAPPPLEIFLPTPLLLVQIKEVTFRNYTRVGKHDSGKEIAEYIAYTR